MALFSATGFGLAVPAVISTMLEVNPPASRFARVVQWSIEFSGISATDVPVIVQACELTVASAVGTVVTAASMIDNQAAVAAAAKSLPATEGTVTVLENHNVPPSSGLVIQYPLTREPNVIGAAAAAKGFSVRANRGAGAAINAACTIIWEE
jgi:hypothetical protein